MALNWPTFDERPLLGANGTEAMQALLFSGVDGLVDYLKVGPFMGRQAIATLAERYPLMLHLDDTLSGHELLSEASVGTIRDLIALTGTPWASEHIGFNAPGVTLHEALTPLPVERILTRDQALENIVRNASDLASRLPVPLLLENVPLFPNRAHLNIAEPGFVSEVLARTGCDLLLDLAHTRSTARLLGLDPQAYLDQLPLDRVVELHLSGPRPLGTLSPERQAWIYDNARTVEGLLEVDGDTLIDIHEAMTEADYQLLAWVLERAQPKAISLEYYRQADALQAQLQRLGGMLGR